MNHDSNQTGSVINIQRFTVHDGPGIRTEVFLKGCPLHCLWCSNPESILPGPQVGVYSERCIGKSNCGMCIGACPVNGDNGAFIVEEDKISGIDRAHCTDCLECAKVCPSFNTLKVWGTRMTVPEVMKPVLADREYYERSCGGITVSGGEALLQSHFVRELFNACKKESIHTCLETALHCSSQKLDKVYPATDLVITDIKHMESSQHKKITGAGNKKILENIEKTVKMNMPLVIRIPIVPGYNDSEENVLKTAQFINERLKNKVGQVQLFPFRQLGVEKYKALGMEYPMKDVNLLDRSIREEKIRALVELMVSFEIPAVAGTSSKIH